MKPILFFFNDLLENPWTMVAVVLGLLPVVLGLFFLFLNPRLFLLIFKNLGRNLLRTTLTCLAIMVLVFMVTMIWTIVFSLSQFTRDREQNVKLIITEKWAMPSMMPPSHANYLDPANPNFLEKLKELKKADGKELFPVTTIKDERGYERRISNDFMSWSFYVGTTEPGTVSPSTLIFFFVMDPEYIRPMMEDLEDCDPALIAEMKRDREAVLVGPDRLAAMNKSVGDRFQLSCLNYKGIDLWVRVIGTLPRGSYGQKAIMNAEYFNNALDKYKKEHNGTPHALDNRRLNLIWLRVPDKQAYTDVAKVIQEDKSLVPQVKVETASNAIGSFMEPYSDLLAGVKYFLVPVILVIMALVIANAISISVRERYQEIAVLKVLGFRPGQILVLVLGESLLLGGLSGLLSASLAFLIINTIYGGVPFPVAFFPAFMIPVHAFWWGLATGFLTAFLGSFLPAWSARSVKVSEVFSKVA
jgi:putative ABC transport system permease protein